MNPVKSPDHADTLFIGLVRNILVPTKEQTPVRAAVILLMSAKKEVVVPTKSGTVTAAFFDSSSNMCAMADRFQKMMSEGGPRWFGFDDDLLDYWGTAFPGMPESTRTLVKNAISKGRYTKEGTCLRVNITEKL